jgi:hypothetical protein
VSRSPQSTLSFNVLQWVDSDEFGGSVIYITGRREGKTSLRTCVSCFHLLSTAGPASSLERCQLN